MPCEHDLSMYRRPAADLGISLRTLYRDASDPGFLGSGQPGETSPVARLCGNVARLPDPRAAAGLACRLRGAATAVRGGEAAAAADLAALEVTPWLN